MLGAAMAFNPIEHPREGAFDEPMDTPIIAFAVVPQPTPRPCGKIVNHASDTGRVGSGGEAVFSGDRGAEAIKSAAIASH
jgi:hypothetical protein